MCGTKQITNFEQIKLQYNTKDTNLLYMTLESYLRATIYWFVLKVHFFKICFSSVIV